MFSTKSKRKNLSIKENYEIIIISDVNKKIKYDTIVSKFRLGNKSTISEVMKKRIELYKNMRRLAQIKMISLKKALMIWRK